MAREVDVKYLAAVLEEVFEMHRLSVIAEFTDEDWSYPSWIANMSGEICTALERTDFDFKGFLIEFLHELLSDFVFM